MRAWFRVVLPFNGLAFGFAVAYAVSYLPQLAYWLVVGGKGGFPLDGNWEPLQIPLLGLAAAGHAAMRAFAFHPAFMADYRTWLNQTPWRPGLPLPVGPIHLVPQDGIVVGVLTALGARHWPEAWWMVPGVFLAMYLACVAIGFVRTGVDRHAWLLGFGLGGAVLLAPNPWGLGLLFLAVYGIAYHGLSLWLKQPGLPVLTDRISLASDTIRSQSQNWKLGWPYDSLAPKRERHCISYGWAAALAVLVGWWVFVLAHVYEESVGLAFLAMLVLPFARLIRYLFGYSPPLSLWARIRTFHWIIPRYDVVFAAPVLALFLLGAGLKWLYGDFHWPLEYAFPPVSAAVVYVTLACRPTLDEWRLTGNHRIVPAVHKQEMQQIS